MLFVVYIFFFKQKTAYEMRISDWSSDVCSSDLIGLVEIGGEERANGHDGRKAQQVRTRKGEDMAEFELIADGLRFPEAPVVMDDDSVIVVEIEAKRITRCWPGGKKEVIAAPGGGPNGLAIGPAGKLYCCNNGGFHYVASNRHPAPPGIPHAYSGGRVGRP